MAKIADILQQPEGRRLELKAQLPSNAELAKSIISFANDAGGEFYLGIQDKPREVTGLDEDSLIELEEKISNIIHDQCAPVILPEILFLNHEGKHIILTRIHKGSAPPYHLKNKGVKNGTYIRVGSSNRQASEEIIAELERQKQNISFDSELLFTKPFDKVNIDAFKEHFIEKTGEKITKQVLSKLDLYRAEQGKELPTIALILLSDDTLRKQQFPYAKIECARFKGTVPGNFIDQKTIDANVSLQAEQSYQFVLRHISQSSVDYTGVYRNDRWEYPIIAIREVIRNAVIHRNYSMTGKDIKIAVFDDKIEITSPGKLMPSVDFSDMDSGQSDIRNKVLAPVFKRLGIIEQWGNGLKLIKEELQAYPEIELSWKEPGIAFRVTFFKKNYTPSLVAETNGVSDGLNKGVDEGVIKGVNEGVNEGVKKGVIEDVSGTVRNGMIAVVGAIMDNKEIRANMIAKKLSLSVSTIERYIDLLKRIGLVEYKGAPKTGTYYLTDKMKSKLKTKE